MHEMILTSYSIPVTCRTFGARHEFELQRDILNKLNVPYVCVIGNHDCIATGEEAFRQIFGERDYSFTAGNVRFICLNTNALEFDRSQPVPNFDFIKTQVKTFPTTAEKPLWQCMPVLFLSSSTTTLLSLFNTL